MYDYEISFPVERGVMYDIQNNGTLLKVESQYGTVAYEYIPVGCEYVRATLQHLIITLFFTCQSILV